MKPGKPPLQSIRLLDQVRERIRYVHCSFNSDKNQRVLDKIFIRRYKIKSHNDMLAPHIQYFLDILATQRKVSA